MAFKKAGKVALIGAALMTLSATPTMAAQTGTTTTTTSREEPDRGFPWGLLGLLGLAGLLGLKRKERDIHVDNRRNT